MHASLHRPAFLAAAALGSIAQDQSGGRPGGDGFNSAIPSSPECITLQDRFQVAADIADYVRRFGPLSEGPADGPGLYPFYPQAGRLHGDITVNNFVDMNPASGPILDYQCGASTYDGHLGIDSVIRWRDDQLLGVPVFAVLDGVVVSRADGNFDQNTSCAGNPPANFVIIDHGGGRQTYYWHLKNGSVSVATNQQVKRGQQIGLTASSGCSTGPHLHLESHQGAPAYEAFAGACRAGASGWLHQENPPATPFLTDFGVTTTNLAGAPGYPIRYPTSAQFPTSATVIYYWARYGSLPANSTFQFIFVRPNGVQDYVSNVLPFENNTTLIRDGVYWFSWNVTNMHSITGTWHVKMLFNGQLMIDAPVQVVQTITPGFNRPPQPVSLALDPVAPTATDAVLCRVLGVPALADLDWDRVRYRYLWKRNGAVVRDVVTVGSMDALPRGLNRDIVECTVTPNDGHVDGPSSTIRVEIGCPVNCDASSAPPVLNANDFQCFVNAFAAASPGANCDGSTSPPILNANDFQCFVNAFAIGCP